MRHNALSNMFFAALSKCVAIIGPFAVRTIIVYKLGNEYVGLNSLFTSILNVLNLAELGFGSAMTFSMYKPANEGDYEKLSSLLNFYKFVYRIIGVIILVLGLALTPFIKCLINGTYPENVNIYVLFIIYLLNTVASYTLFAYKSSILVANCRNDILYAIQGIVQFIMYVVQIVVFIITSNYYFYIIFLPLFTIINNALIYYITRKNYPEYIDSGKLDTFEKVISTILGLNALALFSNYFYLVNAINGLVEIVMASIVSTVGNTLLNYSVEQSREQFYFMSYVSNILIGTCTICFFNLFQPFIKLWVGEKNLLPVGTMFLFCIYFYTWRIRTIGLLYRDAAGLWKRDAMKSLVGVVLDLLLDVVLVTTIGVNGALFSTILIMVFVFYPWETKVLFNDLFHCSPSRYVYITIQNVVVTLILFMLSWCFMRNVEIHNVVLDLVARLGFSVFVSAVGFIFPTIRTREFKIAYRRIAKR